MHYYRFRIVNLHIATLYVATLAEIDQEMHHSLHFLPMTIQLALNFNLSQLEKQQIYYINSTSLASNSKPKTWHLQQGLI